MPKCNLSQSFWENIPKNKSKKIIHYYDEELVGFFLEYRYSGTGTWYFKYRDNNLKMRFFRIGTTEKMNAIEAREFAYRIYYIVSNGGTPSKESPFRSSILLNEFIEKEYLPYIKLKKRSWYVDNRILNTYILPVFGKQAIGTIKRMNIIAWQKSLPTKNLAPCSCNRILSVMKTLFNIATKWGLLDSFCNPCKDVTPFIDNSARNRYLNKDEAYRVITKLRELKENPKAIALQLLLFTGARKSEILKARWEYIDIENHILTVPLSKSGKARHIPLSDEAINIIKKIPRDIKSPWLFPSALNPSKSISSIYNTWDNIRNELGLYDVRIHDLRHSFASILVNAGCSLYEVQKILGHYNPKVTMRYAHLAQASLINATNMIEKSVYDLREKI